jgi:hypothetical protein
MGKSNTHIFREIARRCTIDVAISLSGVKLTNGRGNAVNDEGDQRGQATKGVKGDQRGQGK